MKICALTCICVDVFDGLNEISPGGEALNFSVNCSRYPYIECYLIGAIGNDFYGEVIRDSISDKRINTEHMHIADEVTASNITYLTPEGDRYYKSNSWTGGAYQSFQLSERDKELICSSDIVHTSVLCPIFNDILALKREQGFKFAVDFNVHRKFEEWEKFISDIDFFFISGEESILPQLMEWSERHSGIFIATLAERGSICYHNGKTYRAQAVCVDPTDIVDTTGCGDSYQAGFIASYCSDSAKGDIQLAMEEGSRLAAQTLLHFGGFR